MAAAKTSWLPLPFFPTPQGMFEVFLCDWPQILHSASFSVWLLAKGFFFGAVAGFLIGLGILRKQGRRVDDAIRMVGLDGFDKACPHQLSGGMAQRVALARAPVNRPNLLLLDEPLGKLDRLTRLAMQTEPVDLWQRTGLTAVLVAHDVEEALFLSQRCRSLARARPGSSPTWRWTCPIRAGATIPC